ncbi:MAG: outer membrane protein [Flavobacteriales bacterium]|jgi:outer membrane protein
MKKNTLALVVLASLTTSQFATAFEQGDLIIRVGLTTVTPDESSPNVFVDGGDLGFGLNVDDNTQLGLNFAYFVTNNWDLEVLAATPFKHDININTNVLGLEKLGEVTHLTPNVTANYFFADNAATFQPYAGVGFNYSIFFDENFTSTNEAIGFSDLDLDGSFGMSEQVGFDYMIDNKWFVNT